MANMLVWISCSLLATGITFGQEYPVLRKVQIGVNVTHDSSSGMFYYNYSMTNDSTNVGEVEEFTLVIWRDSASTVAYDTSGLVFAGNEFSESSFREDFPYLGSWIVPVGFVRLPKGWLGLEIGRHPEVSVARDTDFLKPGQAVVGIDMMSRGLPGVRECVVKPNFNVDLYLPNEENVETIDSIEGATNYYGLTVGPWAPPSKFDPLVFLDTLTSFVHESREQGWILSNEGAKKFVHLLGDAREKIQQSDVKVAAGILEKILTDVEADESRTLKPEAYALIRYNTEYLVRQLVSTKARKN